MTANRYRVLSLFGVAILLSALLMGMWPMGRASHGAQAAASRPTDTPTASATPGSPFPNSTGIPTAAIVISPAAGPPQTNVIVSGENFNFNAKVTIAYIDPQINPQYAAAAATVATATTTANGDLPPTRITIPAAAAPGGIGMVVVSYPGLPLATASAIFGVTPLNRDFVDLPGVLSPGEPTLLSGSGFQAGAPVQLELTDATGTQIATSAPITSTITGSIGPLGFTVPLTTAVGLGTINAVDSAGNVEGVPIVVLPAGGDTSGSDGSLHLVPTRVTLGTSVSIAAGGFTAHEPIALTLIGADGTGASVPATGPLIADDSGRLQASFVLPTAEGLTRISYPLAGAAGSGNTGTMITVALRGAQSGITRTAPLVISGTRLQATPSATVPGHPYTIVGTGFQAGEKVNVTLTDARGAISPAGTTQASNSGSFTLYSTAPVPAGGNASNPNAQSTAYTLIATGGASSLVATERLVVNNAPALTLHPYVAAPGQNVLMQGTTFAPNATVTLQVGFLPGSGHSPLQPFLAATDKAGAFVASVTVPLTATAGPVAIQAQDGTGSQASTVLTVNAQPATAHVTPLTAHPGQAITVRGSGFGSGETVDLFLAVPSSVPAPLPESTIPATADAQGSFVASYILPGSPGAPFLAGSYLLGVSGETSQRQAITAFTITPSSGTPGPKITPTPPATRTPVPVPCPSATASGSRTQDSCTGSGDPLGVTYFASGATGRLNAATPSHTPAVPVSFQEDLQVLNTGDHPATVTVAYLLYSTTGESPQAVRTYTFVVPAHTVQTRSVNADIGGGHLVSVIVRAVGVLTVPGAGSRGTGAQLGTVRATLIMRRTAYPPGPHASAVELDAAGMSVLPAGVAGKGQSDPSSPSTTWYFAEGYTGSAFDESLSLLNPQPANARVTIKLLGEKGALPGSVSLSIPPFARQSVDVGAAYLRLLGTRRGVTIPGADVGISVSSTEPIVAERTLYWGKGAGWSRTGYDVARGAIAARKQSYFAYASTLDGDQAYLSIVNPAACTTAKNGACRSPAGCARVRLTAFTGSGMSYPLNVHLCVQPQSRVTVPLRPLVDRGIYALAVNATLPVVSELAQYIGGAPAEHPGLDLQGTSGALGLSGAGFVASPSTGPLIRVFNPTSGRIVVRVSGITNSGVYFPRNYQISAGASLELELPSPGAHSAMPAGRASAGSKGSGQPTHAPLGVSITCSKVCVGAALSGVHDSAGKTAASAQEVWGSALQ